MVVALQRYNTSELLKPKKIFETEGMQVTVVSSEKGEAVSSDGVAVPVDLVNDQVKVKNFNAIVFVGGSGSIQYINSIKAHTIARDAISQKKVLSAICGATSVLAQAGVLKGKRATGAYRLPIVNSGGIFGDELVITDRKLVTGAGPTAADEFTRAIIAALKTN